jgi:hypothetical protein
MVTQNPIREQLKQELHQIPDGKLAEILDLVHYFRLGVQLEQRGGVSTESAPATTDDQFLEELRACIRKPNPAPLGEFRLNLEGYRFSREEANER